MRDDHAAFQAVGAKIVVITAHELDKVKAYWAENKIPFLGVADPEGVVSKPYGQQWKLVKMGQMPAQFVLDCQGQIAFAHYGSSMKDIPENAAMLTLLKALPRCSE